MMKLAQCAASSGLASGDIGEGAGPSTRHRTLLSSYLLNLHRGAVVVRKMIARDYLAFLDLGAKHRAADLVVVMRQFLSEFPEARPLPLERSEADEGSLPSNIRHQCRDYIVASRAIPHREFAKSVSLIGHQAMWAP